MDVEEKTDAVFPLVQQVEQKKLICLRVGIS